MDQPIKDAIQQVLLELEENLCAEIPLEEWAAGLGYSPWYFSRQFQSIVGMPLGQYRTRRRLMHALYAISRGESITNAALRFGFDTHAGFFKAFQQEYGCSPSQYIKLHRVNRPRPLILKEERYPMISNLQWKQALAHWGLDAPLSPIVYPGSGRIHESCRKAGEHYLLKAYTDETLCQRQVRLFLAMKDHQLPAPCPLPLSDGAYTVALGGLHFTLSRAMEGKPLLAAHLLEGPIRENGRCIGRALFQLHQALDHMTPCPIDQQQCLADTLRYWALPSIRQLQVLDEGWLRQYEEKMLSVFSQLPTGPIHRDPNPSNLILLPQGGIGFADFDLAECNLRLFDPCYAATAVLSECFEKRDTWPLFLEGIMAGYGEEQPLSAQEKQAVPLIALAMEMICLAAFQDQDKYQDVFAVNLQMLNWMKELPMMAL